MATPLKLLILGPPGSGKGTICKKIVDTYILTHLSSGDILRGHIRRETGLGKEVKSYLDKGFLVPNEVMVNLMTSEIRNVVSGSGWILDGFPRTLAQGKELATRETFKAALYLDVPFRTIIDRVKDRLVHLPSGRIYNLQYNKPKIPGKDDITGEPLTQRSDDKAETVLKRLEEYKRMTEPLLEFYKEREQLKTFSGDTSDAIWIDVKRYLDSI